MKHIGGSVRKLKNEFQICIKPDIHVQAQESLSSYCSLSFSYHLSFDLRIIFAAFSC
jgi:hypothetical protein